MNDEVDYSEYYKKQEAERKKHQPVYDDAGYVYNLSSKKNLGTLVCRMINDEITRVPTALVWDCWEMWLPTLTEDKEINADETELFVLPDVCNYLKELTDSQNTLYDEVSDLMSRVSEAELGWTIYDRPEVNLFYAKPAKLIRENKEVALNEKQRTQCFKHCSKNFFKSWTKAIDQKSIAYDNSTKWMSDYFKKKQTSIQK